MTRDVSADFAEKPYIEFVMVADHAEAINGKLYLHGGGWTDFNRPIVPGRPVPMSAFSIVLSLYIPWGETNRPLDIAVKVEDQDGVAFFELKTQAVVGRAPQLPLGEGQHTPLGVQVVAPFPKPGGYRVVATLEGKDTKTWAFRVHDVQQQKLAS